MSAGARAPADNLHCARPSPAPRDRLSCLFARHGFHVFLVNEFRTSKVCFRRADPPAPGVPPSVCVRGARAGRQALTPPTRQVRHDRCADCWLKANPDPNSEGTGWGADEELLLGEKAELRFGKSPSG